MIDFLAVFIVFFAVIDPIGTVPVFIAITKNYSDGERKKIALLTVCVSAVILLFFVVAGEFLLDAMSIPIAAFQTGGGIVLFLFALTMIFGESKPEEEIRMIPSYRETAIFPLAVPSIAGPGAMLAAVLMTEKARFGISEQAQTVAVMIAVLFLAYLLMLCSNYIHRLIGSSGASVVSRVMGLILAAVATNNTLLGLKAYFGIP
ncbi:MAG: MarC family protein [Pseudomonadota bacterium]